MLAPLSHYSVVTVSIKFCLRSRCSPLTNWGGATQMQAKGIKLDLAAPFDSVPIDVRLDMPLHAGPNMTKNHSNQSFGKKSWWEVAWCTSLIWLQSFRFSLQNGRGSFWYAQSTVSIHYWNCDGDCCQYSHQLAGESSWVKYQQKINFILRHIHPNIN